MGKDEGERRLDRAQKKAHGGGGAGCGGVGVGGSDFGAPAGLDISSEIVKSKAAMGSDRIEHDHRS